MKSATHEDFPSNSNRTFESYRFTIKCTKLDNFSHSSDRWGASHSFGHIIQHAYTADTVGQHNTWENDTRDHSLACMCHLGLTKVHMPDTGFSQ